MEAKGFTDKDLAEHTGVKPQNVRGWLADKDATLPRMVNVLEIADLLECTPSDLLGY